MLCTKKWEAYPASIYSLNYLFRDNITERARHCSRGLRESSGRHTYLWHRILRTRRVSRSAACRRPAAGSTRSDSSPRWSHTQARSHCCTGGHRQKLMVSTGVCMPLTPWREIIIYKRKHLCSFSAIPIVSTKVFDLTRASFKDTQKSRQVS